MPTENIDDIFSSDPTTVWQGVAALCQRVSLYFSERIREDLASDAMIHVHGKLHKVKAEGGSNPKAYLDTIAFNYMKRAAGKWRKQGRSLDGIQC